MLTNLKELLNEVCHKKSAVGSFNVYNMETIISVVGAARKLNSPVIIAFGESYFSYAPIEAIASVVKQMSRDYDLPVVLHLDHAKSFSSIIKAIRSGFTSVMYDGSELSFDENVKKTRTVVDLAHAVGVSVEGELGYLNKENGMTDLFMEMKLGFTEPDKAAEFAKITGIDALAVAIGNAHGFYKGVPVLDFERLSQIRELVDTPLVLHGCSGIPDDTIKKAVSIGVRKINVNTEISAAAVEAIRKVVTSNYDKHLRFEQVLKDSREKMAEVVEKYIRLLNYT